MTTLTPDGPARPDAPTSRAAVATAVVALVLAVLELGFGAWAWIATDEAARTSDDPLTAIGYLVALAIGVPGVVGLLLAALGWVLADRVAGLVLAILGAGAVAVPALLWLIVASPGL